MNISESLKAKQTEVEMTRYANALATLAKYQGRFRAYKFNREDCYGR